MRHPPSAPGRSAIRCRATGLDSGWSSSSPRSKGSAGSCRELLAILGDRHTAPAPVFHLDFLKDNPCPFGRLSKHVIQNLANPFVDRGLLFGGHMVDTGFGAF